MMIMSMENAYDERFDFDRADRMRRALRVSGISVSEMADLLTVSRNTIGNWINGRAEPRPRDMRDFALKTGMPLEWVRDGISPSDNDSGPSGGVSKDSSKITTWLLASGENVTPMRPRLSKVA